MFDVEMSVPMPKPKNTYPFSSMKAGDSFFVPDGGVNAICSAAKQWGRRNATNTMFRCRTRTENGVKGVRCWRVS